jgi:hypothetical protein
MPWIGTPARQEGLHRAGCNLMAGPFCPLSKLGVIAWWQCDHSMFWGVDNAPGLAVSPEPHLISSSSYLSPPSALSTAGVSLTDVHDAHAAPEV